MERCAGCPSWLRVVVACASLTDAAWWSKSAREKPRAVAAPLAAAPAPAPARRPLAACVVEDLPSSMLRPDVDGNWRTARYGSGRVAWHYLGNASSAFGAPSAWTWVPVRGNGGIWRYAARAAPRGSGTLAARDGTACDAVFWQLNWAEEAASVAAAVGGVARVVFGWRAEDCGRAGAREAGVEVAWYEAPGDTATWPIRLPIGPANVFPLRDAGDGASYEYLFNFVASLETHKVRRQWLAAALDMRATLERDGSDACSFVRARKAWVHPAKLDGAGGWRSAGEDCGCPRAGASCRSARVGTAAVGLTPEEWHVVAAKSAFTLAATRAESDP